MIVLDKMLIGSIKFVLGKVVAAAQAELDDDSHLREELLATQMRFELGEITQEEFGEIETQLLARLREIRERREGLGGPKVGDEGVKVVGVDASVGGDE